MINSLAYENAKNPTQAAGFATATGSKGCYCLMRLPDHDRTTQVFPDTMHLMKNVTSELVQLITGYKVSQKVRKTEQLLGRFPSTWVLENQEISTGESATGGKWMKTMTCLLATLVFAFFKNNIPFMRTLASRNSKWYVKQKEH